MTPDFTQIELGAPRTRSADGESWASPENIDIQPAYGPEDIKALDHLNTYPGLAPYIRGPYPTMFQAVPGPSANMPASPPPRTVMPFTAAISTPARKACPSPSIWPHIAAMTVTIRACRAMSAWPGSP